MKSAKGKVKFDLATHSDDAPPSLEITGWVPPCVARNAKALYERLFQAEWRRELLEQSSRELKLSELKVLCRLVSDPRMETVWSELYKKKRHNHRPSETFLHTVNPEELKKFSRDQPTTANDRQDSAVVSFFYAAFYLAFWNDRLIPASVLREKRKPFIRAATDLKSYAQTLRSLGISSEHPAALEKASLACMEEANLIKPPHTFFPVVRRRSGRDENVRAYVMSLGDMCRRLFGTPLHRTVATTASVVLSRSVTQQQVRDAIATVESGL